MSSRILRTAAVAVLSSAAALAGPAVAHAQDDPCSVSVDLPKDNITLSPGPGSSGQAVGEAISASLIESAESDDIVKAWVCQLTAEHPGKNVMVIQQETYDGPDGLTGVTADFDAAIAGNDFDVFVFDTGSFTNDGDLGWVNWGFGGTFTRSEDQRTVTFS